MKGYWCVGKLQAMTTAFVAMGAPEMLHDRRGLELITVSSDMIVRKGMALKEKGFLVMEVLGWRHLGLSGQGWLLKQLFE